RSRPRAHPSHRRNVRRADRAHVTAPRRRSRAACLRGVAVTTRVLLVDDHALLRAGLRSRLEKEPGIEVVGRADSAERAVVLARSLQPDLVLLDLLLPRKNGFDAIPEIVRVAPDARVIVVSSQTAASSVRRALTAGAAGYLPKRASDSELVAAIQQVSS